MIRHALEIVILCALGVGLSYALVVGALLHPMAAAVNTALTGSLP